MNTCTHNSHTRSNGFTLIEILIVVLLLGTLAAVVISQFSGVRDDAQKTAFIASSKIFVEAARRFQLDTGSYPEDARSGRLPDGFGEYVLANKWVIPTPIGGQWDTELNSFGFTSTLGVHFRGGGPRKDDAYMQEIDAAIDDGDLGSGAFRKLGPRRYYFVVAE